MANTNFPCRLSPYQIPDLCPLLRKCPSIQRWPCSSSAPEPSSLILTSAKTTPILWPQSVPVWTVCLSLSSRSEEHTSELQSQSNIVCRLLLEKKKLEALIYMSLPAHHL